MKFHIPFTVVSLDRLRKRHKFFKSLIKHKKKSALQDHLSNCDTLITREEYLNVVFTSFSLFFIVLTVILTTVLALLNVNLFFVYGPLVALLFALFVMYSQLVYPKVYSVR